MNISTWVLPSGATVMRFASEQRLEQRRPRARFTLGEIPGVLWTPGAAEYGFAAAAIDAPGLAAVRSGRAPEPPWPGQEPT